VYSQIDDLRLPGRVATDRPCPSLGSLAAEPWSTIKVHFDEHAGSVLMEEVIVSWLRKTPRGYRAIVGLLPTIALQRAKCSREWSDHVAQIRKHDPTLAAIKLQLRDSDPARSKKFAEAQAAKEQVAAAKARQAHQEVGTNANRPETLRATLDTQAPFEAQLGQWLN
ncbi:unnamed protein product, partial [Prorocentrum cordatum]